MSYFHGNNSQNKCLSLTNTVMLRVSRAEPLNRAETLMYFFLSSKPGAPIPEPVDDTLRVQTLPKMCYWAHHFIGKHNSDKSKISILKQLLSVDGIVSGSKDGFYWLVSYRNSRYKEVMLRMEY